MAVLYFEKMKIDPKNPQWAERDRLVLSPGHATVALYPTLALEGIFSGKAAENVPAKIDGSLSGHAEMRNSRRSDMSTGSLGQGSRRRSGWPAAKMTGNGCTVYAILGDGEFRKARYGKR